MVTGSAAAAAAAVANADRRREVEDAPPRPICGACSSRCEVSRAMSSPVIALTDVELTLRGNAGPVKILRGVTLSVAKGETLGLVGPSGSGKSSLLMLMGGLESATAGYGDGARPGPHADERGRAGAVPPRPHGRGVPVVPPDPDDDGARERRDPAGARRARATPSTARRRSCARSGSAHGSTTIRRSCRAASSSGWRWPAPSRRGRRSCSPTSRPAISTATTGEAIVELLFGLRDRSGATLVLVTHAPDLAARCDRVVRLRDGRLERFAEAAE